MGKTKRTVGRYWQVDSSGISQLLTGQEGKSISKDIKPVKWIKNLLEGIHLEPCREYTFFSSTHEILSVVKQVHKSQ